MSQVGVKAAERLRTEAVTSTAQVVSNFGDIKASACQDEFSRGVVQRCYTLPLELNLGDLALEGLVRSSACANTSAKHLNRHVTRQDLTGSTNVCGIPAIIQMTLCIRT
eukprot:7151923-Karenia_brevis.AAC.1